MTTERKIKLTNKAYFVAHRMTEGSGATASDAVYRLTLKPEEREFYDNVLNRLIAQER